MKHLVLLSIAFTALMGGLNAAIVVALRDFPLAFFNAGVVVAAVGSVVYELRIWRRLKWDSPKNPTSKSSLPSPSPSNFQSSSQQLLQAIPRLSQSASPCPLEPLPQVKTEAPIVGFREWRIAGEGLTSITDPYYTWSPQANVATCRKGWDYPADVHPSPIAGCSCGFYSCQRLPERPAASHALGATLSWGRIIRHGTEGFRSEYARPICLAIPRRQDFRVFGKGALVACPRPTAFVVGTGHTLLRGQLTCDSCGEPLADDCGDAAWEAVLNFRGAMAERLGLPLVPEDSLEAYAMEFGQSITDLEGA